MFVIIIFVGCNFHGALKNTNKLKNYGWYDFINHLLHLFSNIYLMMLIDDDRFNKLITYN